MSFYCTEVTIGHTVTTADTFIRINLIDLSSRNTGNGISRTVSGTERAGPALGRIDGVGKKILTDVGRTYLIDDMGLILITEIAERGEDRIRCCLAQAAEGGILYLMTELFHFFQELHGTLAFCNLGQHLQQTFGTHTNR